LPAFPLPARWYGDPHILNGKTARDRTKAEGCAEKNVSENIARNR
jgi:hypothetical protein